jgi:hypothetical protein
MEWFPLNVAPRAGIVLRTRSWVSSGTWPLGQPDGSWAHAKRAGRASGPDPRQLRGPPSFVSGSSITLADKPLGPMMVRGAETDEVSSNSTAWSRVDRANEGMSWMTRGKIDSSRQGPSGINVAQ